MANPNPFTLAAEGSSKLLPLLQAKPELASSQDDTGYSLVHAAASYNHLDLLRTLVKDFHVDVNIKDEDGETALFVVETVEAAQTLLDELGADLSITNEEGMTAEEKIRTEGDYTTISDYLRECQTRGTATGQQANSAAESSDHLPPLPANMSLQLGSLQDEQSLGEVADPVLRQRIEELASRDDFRSEDGQMQLRQLVTDALRGTTSGERNTRPRME